MINWKTHWKMTQFKELRKTLTVSRIVLLSLISLFLLNTTFQHSNYPTNKRRYKGNASGGINLFLLYILYKQLATWRYEQIRLADALLSKRLSLVVLWRLFPLILMLFTSRHCLYAFDQLSAYLRSGISFAFLYFGGVTLTIANE